MTGVDIAIVEASLSKSLAITFTRLTLPRLFQVQHKTVPYVEGI